MSHVPHHPCSSLFLSHSDLFLPIFGSADESPPWQPKNHCLLSYGIITSSCNPRVEFLAKGNEVVDVVIPSQLHHSLGSKILLKTHGLKGLYPCCSITLMSIPMLNILVLQGWDSSYVELVVPQGICEDQGRVCWWWIVGRSYQNVIKYKLTKKMKTNAIN